MTKITSNSRQMYEPTDEAVTLANLQKITSDPVTVGVKSYAWAEIKWDRGDFVVFQVTMSEGAPTLYKRVSRSRKPSWAFSCYLQLCQDLLACRKAQ